MFASVSSLRDGTSWSYPVITGFPTSCSCCDSITVCGPGCLLCTFLISIPLTMYLHFCVLSAFVKCFASRTSLRICYLSSLLRSHATLILLKQGLASLRFLSRLITRILSILLPREIIRGHF